MKRSIIAVTLLLALALLPVLTSGQAGGLAPIQLSAPNKTRGLPVMEALSVRASVREWSDRDLSLQDLSDLLWAANGINRPDGRKTASSAMNAQDVDIYAFMKAGVYLYDAATSTLKPVLAGDHRTEIVPARPAGPGGPGAPGAKPGEKPPAKPEAKPQAPPPAAKPEGKPAPGGPQAPPPVLLVLVSDISRFSRGEMSLKLEWAAIDVGIVSQNISLFCAATGIGTRPRATMDRTKIRELLKLSETQYPLLNHPVGYKQ
jgi:nitroreductase